MKRNSIVDYWNKKNVESMYDKYLLKAEINLIKKYITPHSKILDAGCGEGEGTLEYSFIKGTVIHGADFSDTRLKLAKERLKKRSNVFLKKIDFLSKYKLDLDYDLIISQRFLINLVRLENQKKVITDLVGLLKPGGKLIMLEGSQQGVESLNKLRRIFKLPPIPIKWHNIFFDDKELLLFMNKIGCKLIQQDGLGAYFFLTRGIRPFFDKTLDWNNEFNKLSSLETTFKMLDFGVKFSRLKLWVFQKINTNV